MPLCLINTAPPSSSALQLPIVPPFIMKAQPLPISTAPPSSPALQFMIAPPFIMNLPYLVGVSVTPELATSTAPPSPSASVQFTILPLSRVSVPPLTSNPQFLFCPSILPPVPLSFTVRFPLLHTRNILSSVELQLRVYPLRSRVTVRSTSSFQVVSMFPPNLISVQSAFSNAASSSVSSLTVESAANADIGTSDSTMHSVSRTVSSLVFMVVVCILICSFLRNLTAIKTLLEFSLPFPVSCGFSSRYKPRYI